MHSNSLRIVAIMMMASCSFDTSNNDLSHCDTAKDIQSIQYCADNAHIQSQYNLVALYLEGRDVPKDEARAFSLTKKLAEQGEIGAQINLAWFYREGIGVKQDNLIEFLLE